LIPIIPLDGGRIFKEILTNFIGNKNANEFMIISTKVILAIITLIYSIVIFKMKNIAIFLLIIYLWYLYLIEEKKVKMVSKVYDALSKNLI
jgi:stage IV sporulation protein FB